MGENTIDTHLEISLSKQAGIVTSTARIVDSGTNQVMLEKEIAKYHDGQERDSRIAERYLRHMNDCLGTNAGNYEQLLGKLSGKGLGFEIGPKAALNAILDFAWFADKQKKCGITRIGSVPIDDQKIDKILKWGQDYLRETVKP